MRRAKVPRVITTERLSLVAAFKSYWRMYAGPILVEEYRFAPPRRWRFDFVHLASGVAVELEGGVWSGGRHIRPEGFEKDVEKYNRATELGYKVIRITAKMLHGDPAGTVDMLIRMMA